MQKRDKYALVVGIILIFGVAITSVSYSIPVVEISPSSSFPENCGYINEWQTADGLYINLTATEVLECGN